jgi:hypothetical protein
MDERTRKRISAVLSHQPKTVSEWIEAKKTFPEFFTVNEVGDLKSPSIRTGEIDIEIHVEHEIPGTIEHIQAYFNKRREDLKEPEENYTAAKRHLHDMMDAYRQKKVDIADVLEANQNVHTAECILNNVVKLPRRYLSTEGKYEKKDLTLQHYDIQKLADPVGEVVYTTFPWKAFWMNIADSKKTINTISESESTSETDGVVTQEETTAVKTKRAITPQIGAIIAARKARMNMNQ